MRYIPPAGNTIAENLSALLDLAFAEFHRDGRVTTARCDECEGLIEIEEVSDSVWAMNCSCGKFTDTLRGI